MNSVLHNELLHFAAEPSVPSDISYQSPVIETLPTRLECRWTPFLNETVIFSWTDNNNTVVTSEMEGNFSVVKFTEVSRYDAGSYTCTVTTAAGSITGGPVSLVVHCECMYFEQLCHLKDFPLIFSGEHFCNKVY